MGSWSQGLASRRYSCSSSWHLSQADGSSRSMSFSKAPEKKKLSDKLTVRGIPLFCPCQYASAIACLAVHFRSAFGDIILCNDLPLERPHAPTHLPQRVRSQYFSKSALVLNCSPSDSSKGVRTYAY